MRPSSSIPMAGIAGIPGQQNIGVTLPLQPVFTGGIVDMDLITPGIQTNPGFVTPTGPSVVVGGPGGGVPLATVETAAMLGGSLNSMQEVATFGFGNGPPSLVKN